MGNPILDTLGDLKISPGETVRVTVGGRTLVVYEPVGPDDDGFSMMSAPPTPDPPGGIVRWVPMSPPERPEPYVFDDSDMAPGFDGYDHDLPDPDAGRAAGPG